MVSSPVIKFISEKMEKMKHTILDNGDLIVIFGEAYGYRIQSWRNYYASVYEFETVPKRTLIVSNELPTDASETYEWLKQFKKTQASLNPDVYGRSEGVVIRTQKTEA